MGFFLDVHHPWFTVFGYPMSALELFGTLANIWAVWLMTRKHVWTWPVGLVATALFAVLFFEIRMYSDVLEQAYYFATNLWGWRLWTRSGGDAAEPALRPRYGKLPQNLALAAAVAACSLGLGFVMSRVHLWWPGLFPQPASFAYLDAFTTAMSFLAQMLSAYMRMENWWLWMLVNAISSWMYWRRGVAFVAALFAAFFGLAVKGWWSWRRELAPAQRLSPAQMKRSVSA